MFCCCFFHVQTTLFSLLWGVGVQRVISGGGIQAFPQPMKIIQSHCGQNRTTGEQKPKNTSKFYLMTSSEGSTRAQRYLTKPCSTILRKPINNSHSEVALEIQNKTAGSLQRKPLHSQSKEVPVHGNKFTFPHCI